MDNLLHKIDTSKEHGGIWRVAAAIAKVISDSDTYILFLLSAFSVTFLLFFFF